MPEFRLHYKNKPYRVWGEARHSETLEMLTVYECLYPNDLGTLWVRPRDMFHEDVELSGKKIGRFRKVEMKLDTNRTGDVTTASASFEGDVVGSLSGRAMKDAYETESLIVRQDRRKVGVGPALLKKHEELAREQGLKIARGLCANTSRGEINLYLASGYLIVGTRRQGSVVEVVLEKNLDHT